MAFRVGQKVVCIKRGKWEHEEKGRDTVPIRYGDVLTIRTIEFVCGAPYLRFVEVRNRPQQWRDEFAEAQYAARRFRPVADRPTSIAVFTKILNDVNAGKVREIVDA